MRYIYLLIIIVVIIAPEASAQTEPALPPICLNKGNTQKNNMTVSGTTTFNFTTVAEFDNSQSSNAITVTVRSSQKYRLYIAGVMTGITASSTNTPIPINTFTISSTNRGSSPATVTLSNSYVEVAQFGNSTSGLNHTLTISRNALNTFVQQPGDHTLTLHIRYCQY